MRHIHGGTDEYYTNDVVALSLVQFTIKELNLDNKTLFIEPSAGDGAFIKPLLKLGMTVYGYDINPKMDGIIEADFLSLPDPLFYEMVLEMNSTGSVVSIGNPPFGFASNKAVKFFNVCAEFSDYIAFIVPKTFKKISIHNKLNRSFHLLKEYTVPDNAFLVNGIPHNVPCVFQIWEHTKVLRALKAGNLGKYLITVQPKKADFAMRRVGGRAGEILNGFNHSESSTYFFKEVQAGVLDKLKVADFNEVRDNTVGIRSISQLEIFEYLEDTYAKSNKNTD